MLIVNDRIRIPLRELHFDFARSSGPGGQNVNKVATKAVLRWPVVRSRSLPDDVRERFVARYHRRITREGDLVLQSQRFRDRGRNIADCIEKLRRMLEEVATPPRRRRPTRPTRSSVERRLSGKRHASGRKRLRRAPDDDD
ncbi:MAG: aminoacyl-tRNA hydrolase [Deltaproteobacteria bacterium]|nr:aminoacyl-tRNA hydrolase [Deltaproteobacteria bacterium]MBW2416418.1 aminoacyl-tRNA hydrolase [Deltaproteobacteria bacterium]